MIVMEYVEKGSLFDIIHHTPQELTKDRVVSILGDIAAGMVHLQLLLLRCIKYRLRHRHRWRQSCRCSYFASDVPAVTAAAAAAAAAAAYFGRPSFILRIRLFCIGT
jgi:serine/threonine protein kinase